MSRPDLNLLIALDILLEEGNVTRAAARLHRSPSAMSRTLARLRTITGDPLLVRAGRGLVPTPRAIALREEIAPIVRAAEVALRPAETIDLRTMERTFTLRNREGFVETWGAALLERVRAEAPGVRIRFATKPDKASDGLRDGRVDLETGVIGPEAGPELRVRPLFRDRFVCVVRPGHPLTRGDVSPAAFAAGQHVIVSRRGLDRHGIDDELEALGLRRDIVCSVTSFAEAIALVCASDLITTVPERTTGALRAGLTTLSLPVPSAAFSVALLWHPRMDADPGHRWLREVVLDICGDPMLWPPTPAG